MPSYEVVFRGRAARQIEDLPPAYFRLVWRHLQQLSDVPRPADAKPLRGGAGWSLRVGVYRILYDIDDRSRHVVVYRVKRRRDVYR